MPASIGLACYQDFHVHVACIKCDTVAATLPLTSVRGTNRESTASFCLSKLQGKRLDLGSLLASKKFRGRGDKEGALVAFRELEKAGMGRLITSGATSGASSVCMHTSTIIYTFLHKLSYSCFFFSVAFTIYKIVLIMTFNIL